MIEVILWYFLHFVRSGYINVGRGYMRGVDLYGYNWSRSSRDEDVTAFDLFFEKAVVTTSGGPNNRYNGFSLRCLQE